MTEGYSATYHRRHMVRFILRSLSALLVGGGLLVACSSSPSESADQQPSAAAATEDPTTIPATAIPESAAAENPTATPLPAGADQPDVGEPEQAEESGEPIEPVATPEPLRPAGEPQPTTVNTVSPNNAFIARVSMTASSIEVGWSDREGGAEFHIHRVVRTSDDEPGVEAMTAENLIHVGGGLARFVDEGVEPGTKYWHGVRVISAEGDVIAHGWHRTAAVDDLEPPTAPDGIIAFIENGEVRVIWATPEENYQLHSYQVFRGVDGEPPEQISATWRLDQLSFIDDDPPTGQLVYQIRALDFHWNLSEPGGVTINFP